MEFYQELLLTALVSLLLAFLLGKIAAPAVPAPVDAASVPAAAVLKRSRTSEKRVRFREPAVEERGEFLKDLGSDAVNSEVAVGDEFGKVNMLSIASTEVSLVNDAILEVDLSDIEVNLSDVSCELDVELESRDSVNEGGLEGESVTELPEVKIEEADVELAMQEVEVEEADEELAINATKVEAVESVEFEIETGSRVGDGSHELEGESVTKTPEILVTGKADAMVERLVPAEPNIKVESRDWDVNQVNEAGLEGEIVAESPELPKSSAAEVESEDRDASQGNESVVSEFLGSPTAASEQNNEIEDASQVNASGLEGELVVESSVTLEITEFDAESTRDAVKEEIIELPKSSSVVYQPDIAKNSSPVVSQVKEAGLVLESKNVNAESTTCVAEEEESIIIRSPESGGVEESGGVGSVESLVYQLDIEKNSIPVVSQVKEVGLELGIKNVDAESTTCVVEGEETTIIRLPESGGVEESAGVESVESLLHGEDEWEGIQRSDVEKLFGVAASYTSSTIGIEAVSRLSSDAQMELYGLHKVATEGPCYEPQPLALMVTARVKWHAWQRLGSMNPEVAMEQYISLLTRNIPEWMGAKPGGNIKQEVDGTRIPDSGPSLYSEPSSIIERESENHIGGYISSAIPTLSGQDST